ncbi:GNAT family N-acetyltransferase [uncultured Brevundimonas sp.]|uniref:GNAT family N-acetyltransferase n=1 Tax=uncultured Brevundimonas sp. TaxID=213418 RepID=UPI0030EB19BF|tara:strand:+ start:323 stop:646 length:324 start_codon:yes stop_codon:yes gene_type:complete
MTDAADIRDNVDAHRYELPIDDQIAVVVYNLSPPNLMITETLVPQALEGQGIASRMARHVIADARARQLLILPVCPFFAAFFQKHPEEADVLHRQYRTSLGLADSAS